MRENINKSESVSGIRASVYGIHPVRELIEERFLDVEKIFFEEGKRSEQLFELLKFCRKNRLPYYNIPASKLQELCGTSKHQGVAACCPVKSYVNPEAVLEHLDGLDHPPLVLLPASVEDTGNLGSIIRSAVGFGVDAIFLEQRHTAPISGITAKTSAGMLEHAMICRPRNLEKIISDFVDKKYTIVGAVAGADKTPSDVDMTGPTIIITGGEHRGIPPYLLKQCTALAGIPLNSECPSLNVSNAACVFLYECARQRVR